MTQFMRIDWTLLPLRIRISGHRSSAGPPCASTSSTRISPSSIPSLPRNAHSWSLSGIGIRIILDSPRSGSDFVNASLFLRGDIKMSRSR